jgi:hypothetical protein
MLRVIYILSSLAIGYSVDQAIFGGEYSLRSAAVARDAAQQFNSKIRDLLRPLGK